MISLMIRFTDEQEMFEWIENMVGAQALPASSRVRPEDALDQPTAGYVLDGEQDGGREVQLSTRTIEVTEITTGGEK